MRRTVVGVIAVTTASSVFMLTGLGTASAVSMLEHAPAATAAGFSPTAEAGTLKSLHDALETQLKTKDATGMRATQADLATELAKLRNAAQGAHTAMAPDAVTAVGKATQENDQLGQALAQLTAHGTSANDLPLPLPGGGLGGITSLVSSLLQTLLGLIMGLLGGLPLPGGLPVPVGAPAPHA